MNRTVVNFEQTGALCLLIVIMAVGEESRFVVPLSDEQPKNENRNSAIRVRFSNFDPYWLVTRHF